MSHLSCPKYPRDPVLTTRNTQSSACSLPPLRRRHLLLRTSRPSTLPCARSSGYTQLSVRLSLHHGRAKPSRTRTVCTYVLSLLLLALATQACYDRDVFMKDIDASPSPFPLRVVFAYLRACVFRRGATARRLAVADVCLPGCACDRKLHRLDAGDGDSEVDVEPGEGFIRVPTEDERRNSIVVTFEAVY